MRSHEPPQDGDLGRNTGIAQIERAIASRWWRKDGQLQIAGIPKRIIGSVAGLSVYKVDGQWIKDNLDVTFGTGGHGMVHAFIPLNELWIDPMVESPAALVFHEAAERHYMLHDAMSYAHAHNKALKAQEGRTLTLATVATELEAALRTTATPPGRQPGERTTTYFSRLARQEESGG